MTLNSEQKKAFDIVKNDHSLLLQGAGGTGKSFTIKEIVKWAKENGIQYGITAMTGSAAILIGGTTLHSFLGIGLGNKTPEELAEHVKNKRKFIYNRLRRLELLVIDEISMMDANLFEIISIFLGIIRDKIGIPFGGVPIVISGDMFQLPPVKGKFFFKSLLWDTYDIKMIELQESQRHKDDIEFMNILNELRMGRPTKEIIKRLKATKNNTFPDGIIPTMLYSKNVDVDELNQKKYNELVDKGARCFEYKATFSSEASKFWAQSCKIPDLCKICVGAQVVLTWNIDLEMGLCNGARGIVKEVGISGAIVKFKSCEVLISHNRVEDQDNKNMWMSFMPLRLAYALTINKSQGMTLDCAIVILDKNTNNNEFLYGRAYTALSRVRNLKSIQIINVTEAVFVAHPDVIEFYQQNT